MLDNEQREWYYTHQRCCEPTGGHCRDELTPKQRRRIKHKANRHLGDKPRSRRQRKLAKLREALITPDKAKEVLQKLQERRSTRYPQPSTAQGSESVRDLKERVERHETSLTEAQAEILEKVVAPASESRTCPRCQAADGEPCTMPSGKATNPHKGRLH